MSVKTATVRDLRNHYKALLTWIEAGEEILITRKGQSLARLIPEKKSPQHKKLDWTQSAAFSIDHSGEKILTAKESSALLRASQGNW
jgi:antitoxin (DNA-binding transcriptional repressor) of toxin-antitoxin stability system